MCTKNHRLENLIVKSEKKFISIPFTAIYRRPAHTGSADFFSSVRKPIGLDAQ